MFRPQHVEVEMRAAVPVPIVRALTRLSRREFFGTGIVAGVLGALGVRSAPAEPLRANPPDHSIYMRLLGVRPHLAGHGYTTVVGGSRMPVEVHRAMTEAGEHFVDLFELNEAAGRRLAEVTKAEAAIVTSGSFSGLLLGAAACLSGKDPERVQALPQPTWPKRELVTQKAHRVAYDKAYQVAGMTIVEVETREQLANAVGPKTAMIHAIASVERRHDRTPDVMLPQEVIAIGKRAGVPVLVDLAAELPPVSNLTRYTDMGADLIVISGGKGLRGPQSTGILAGRRDLIDAARLHAFPNTGLGRGMKVGKEEVIGLIAAVNRFLELDHDALQLQWIRTARYVAGELQGVPGLKAEYVPARMTVLGYDAVELTWDPKTIPLTPDQARQKLRDGEPRIIFSGTTFITRNLENGEEVVVARRLRQLFTTYV
jgi:L-seryl-tRNA(Ser) seleniumtransferase